MVSTSRPSMRWLRALGRVAVATRFSPCASATSPCRLTADRGLLAIRSWAALEETRVRWSLSYGPKLAPRLHTRAAAPSIPDDRGLVDDSRSARPGWESD